MNEFWKGKEEASIVDYSNMGDSNLFAVSVPLKSKIPKFRVQVST